MSFNIYGDKRQVTEGGHGVDIASQRADDLDRAALDALAKAGAGANALDVGCGFGGQAVRMARAGAVVTAVDLTCPPDLPAGIRFVQGDMRSISVLAGGYGPFDVIVCQRAIHYLPYADALSTVRGFRALLRANCGVLCISASGLRSELGQGYIDSHRPIALRYSPLASEMAAKHGILGPVCLYEEIDMRTLLLQAGLLPVRIYSSEFGNVKALATGGAL